MVVALALLLAAQSALASRSEVPIQEVILSDGTRRYAVPISIGAQLVQAGLDSGSVGLRALPDAAGGATKIGGDQIYRYGVGTELEGPKAQAAVAIGGLLKTIPLQAVRSVRCEPSRPKCPVSKLSPTQFGIQGNGLPGEGFRAILGTGLAAADLPNPLLALGAHRWIIELPLPGQGQSGRLILNPSQEETSGFAPLTLADPEKARKNDAVRSCLSQMATAWNICAPTLIDTGAPGIEVVNHPSADWPDGTDGYFKFQSLNGSSAVIRFQSGMRKQSSHLMFVRDDRVEGPRVRSGLIVYLACDVLYDADRGSIAVRPRAHYPGGPLASFAEAAR